MTKMFQDETEFNSDISNWDLVMLKRWVICLMVPLYSIKI